MAEVDFKTQIDEDLKEYAIDYDYIPKMSDLDWAFNYWILEKLYSEDIDSVASKTSAEITDDNDMGIDCYVWHEDTKDLYLIQNKHFSEGTQVDANYVQNEFLIHALAALEEGTYTRSERLQKIYTKFKENEEFRIIFNLYVTNSNGITKKTRKVIKEFNNKYKGKYSAHAYDIDAIKEAYFGKPITEKKNMSFMIKTVNDGTILNIDNLNYGLNQAIDAKYALVPVTNIYAMKKEADISGYLLFDENIRDYLGATGTVNKKILHTLNDSEDRKSFFFYNNGITIITDSIKKSTEKGNKGLLVKNPKIVNGCQTVNSIYVSLDSYSEDKLDEEFEDTYVMVKVLEIPSNDSDMEDLKKRIVEYTNSQNAIDQKTFEALESNYLRIQTEFKRKGFLIGIKQSDEYTYKQQYNAVGMNELIQASAELRERFGIEEKNKYVVKDFFCKLEKYLQAVLAFVSTAEDPVQHKSSILKSKTPQNEKVLDFINNTLIENQLALFLLYRRLEQEKKKSDVKISPFYAINCFSHYSCVNGDASKIAEVLSDKVTINKLVTLYSQMIKGYYTEEWIKKHPEKPGYNDMVKEAIDFSSMDGKYIMLKDIILNM